MRVRVNPIPVVEIQFLPRKALEDQRGKVH